MDADSPIRTLRLPRWTSRDTGRALALSLPLLLGGSFGPGLGAIPAAFAGSGSASDPDWLDSLTGPVPVATGAGAIPVTPSPGTAVLPVGGDPKNLALTGISSAQLSQTAPITAPPPVGDTAATAQLTSSGIPVRMLQAYLAAAATTARTTPGCRLHWSLLAGIGRVESNHGRYGGATITAAGNVTPPIYGPLLGDGTRAMGPMQFIPGTWASMGSDANGDGVANPQNVDDATLSAARYLCLGRGDLSTATGRWNAVFRYNRSSSYVALVLALADSYATGKAAPVAAPPAGASTTLPSGSAAAPAVLPGLSAAATATPTPTPTPSSSAAGTSPSASASTTSPPATVTVTTTPATTTTSPGTTTSTPSTTPTTPSTTPTSPTSTTPSTSTSPTPTTTPPATTTTPPASTSATTTSTPPATTSATTTTAAVTTPTTSTPGAT
jgi:Transglycosylase SLT domain